MSPRMWTDSPDARAREAQTIARLWLAEPAKGGDAAASEYHRLFLDGVQPYASAFLDERGFASWSDEPCAWWPKSWLPPDWVRAAATDHIGVSLLALAASDVPAETPEASDVPAGTSAAPHLASWAPVATLALRSYAPRLPYDDLAERTDALVLACLGELVWPADQGEWPSAPDARADDELSLRAVVAWLSVPRCAGWCLTVPDMTRIAGSLDLPGARTGGRRGALATLFQSAGREARVTGLLSALDTEAARAQAHYGQLAARWPAWTEIGRGWAAQVARTRGFVNRLGALAAAESAGGPPDPKLGSARD